MTPAKPLQAPPGPEGLRCWQSAAASPCVSCRWSKSCAAAASLAGQRLAWHLDEFRAIFNWGLCCMDLSWAQCKPLPALSCSCRPKGFRSPTCCHHCSAEKPLIWLFNCPVLACSTQALLRGYLLTGADSSLSPPRGLTQHHCHVHTCSTWTFSISLFPLRTSIHTGLGARGWVLVAISHTLQLQTNQDAQLLV